MTPKQLLAALACAGLLMTAPVTAGAATPRGPSDEFCSAFRDYFQVTFGVSLAASFAETFEDLDDGKGSRSDTPDEVRDTFYLVLAPKLEQVTRVMASSGPRALRKTFRAQAKAFGVGVDLLRDLGITDEQIDAIAEAPFDVESADLDAQTSELDISKADLADAAEELGEQRDEIDVERVGRAQREAYTNAGSRCGAFPSPEVDCETLLTRADVDAVLGVPAERSDDGCEYVGPDPETGVAPALGVDVYESAAAFDTLTKAAQNQSVPGVGDAAVALEGYSLFSGIKTCGKTLVVQAGDRTVVVALCPPDDADVPIATLTGVTDLVLTRLFAEDH